MKGYQFFVVKDFPQFEVGQTLDNQIQTAIMGDVEEVNTSITLTQRNVYGVFDRYNIKTKVKHNDLIYVKGIRDGRRFELTVTEYLKAKEFCAYYDARHKIIFFQTSRLVAKSVIKALKTTRSPIKLSEMVVDFTKVKAICPEIETARVTNVNSRVKSATLTGKSIQNDPMYMRGLAGGDHSSVIISWPYDSIRHPVMVGSGGAIALVKNYSGSSSYELELVMHVYENLLSKTWMEKPKVRRGRRAP